MAPGTGDTGDPGDTGDTGVTGDTEDAGVTGVARVTGDAGDTGVTGVTGDAGDTGDAGVAGDAGVTGVIGVTGDAGVTGVARVTGVTGDTDHSGASGCPWVPWGCPTLAHQTGALGCGCSGSIPSRGAGRSTGSCLGPHWPAVSPARQWGLGSLPSPAMGVPRAGLLGIPPAPGHGCGAGCLPCRPRLSTRLYSAAGAQHGPLPHGAVGGPGGVRGRG